MAKLIVAIVITVWGAGIVLNTLLGDGFSGSGAYAAGQFVGFAFGLVMVTAGIRFLLRHVNRS